MALDADRVAAEIWQGSLPPKGSTVSDNGFDVLVLSARELQAPARHFPGVRVLHAPLNDDAPTLTELRTAFAAAKAVASAGRSGKKVLVTCAAGRNRSGLIVALSLMMLGMKASQATSLVRAARGEHALSNQYFVRELLMLGYRIGANRGRR
jgi:protein-tyrosine phosphatase